MTNNLFNYIELPANTESLIGSDGTNDYLVIGKRLGFKVAVRPALNPYAKLVGFKVRVVWADDGVPPLKFSDQVTKVFPNVPFNRIDGKRASFFAMAGMGLSILGQEYDAEWFLTNIRKSKIAASAVDTIAELFKIRMTPERRKKNVAILNEAYKLLVTGAPVAEEAPAPVSSKSEGNVTSVDFKKGKAS
jgi:hypothetical protein